MQSTTKLQKVVPKGAPRKFSAQKLFQRECRAYSKKSTLIPPKYKVKREKSTRYRWNRRRRSSKDVPKGMQNLHRKINGEHQKINGEEAPKSFLRGCRACVFQYGRMGVCLRHQHHFASYHHIIPHSITSYIISHQWHESNTKSIFGECFVKTSHLRKQRILSLALKQTKLYFLTLCLSTLSFFL